MDTSSMEEDPPLESVDLRWRTLCNCYREGAGTTNVSPWMKHMDKWYHFIGGIEIWMIGRSRVVRSFAGRFNSNREWKLGGRKRAGIVRDSGKQYPPHRFERVGSICLQGCDVIKLWHVADVTHGKPLSLLTNKHLGYGSGSCEYCWIAVTNNLTAGRWTRFSGTDVTGKSREYRLFAKVRLYGLNLIVEGLGREGVYTGFWRQNRGKQRLLGYKQIKGDGRNKLLQAHFLQKHTTTVLTWFSEHTSA